MANLRSTYMNMSDFIVNKTCRNKTNVEQITEGQSNITLRSSKIWFCL